nr:hypothetical protein [Tanacetum cinerariifolium]
MIVAQQADDVADEGATSVDVDDVHVADAEPSIPSPTPTTQPPPPSQELPSTSQVLPTLPPSPIAQPPSPQQQPQPSQPSHDAEILIDLLHTLLETCTTLTRRVEHLEHDKIAQTPEIAKLKQRVKKLERRNNATINAATTLIHAAIITAALIAARMRKGVVIRDLEETATPSIIIHSEPKSKDKGKGIMVEEPKPLKKQAQMEQDAAYARKLEAELNKNIDWDGKFNYNVAFPKKNKEQIEEEDSKALKRASKSQAEKAAKKQKLDEDVAELKNIYR